MGRRVRGLVVVGERGRFERSGQGGGESGLVVPPAAGNVCGVWL